MFISLIQFNIEYVYAWLLHDIHKNCSELLHLLTQSTHTFQQLQSIFRRIQLKVRFKATSYFHSTGPKLLLLHVVISKYHDRLLCCSYYCFQGNLRSARDHTVQLLSRETSCLYLEQMNVQCAKD